MTTRTERPGYPGIVLAMLLLVYTFNFLDRQILGILAKPIQASLGLSDAEFGAIWQQVQADKERGGLPPEDAEKSDDQLQTEYRKIAERRVRLGLVLAEIGRANNVQVTDQELNNAIMNEARNYPGQERQVLDFYRQNPNAAAQMRAPIYEEKVCDLIFSTAEVTDTPITKEELLKEDDEEG